MDDPEPVAPVTPLPPRHGAKRSRNGRSSVSARVFSVVWALIPIATLGWGAPFTYTYAAIRLRSKVIGLYAGAYGAVAITTLYLLGVGNENSWQGNVGFTIGAIVGAVATAQAFTMRERLLDAESHEDAIVASAAQQLRLRQKARKIAADNPTLAYELQIGRPDLHGRFDDGGLVDVNHVPPEYLLQLPGIDESIAEHIADVRDDIGGFASADDLSVTLGLHPRALDLAADRMIFLR